jgi:hypothetical protein
MRQWDIFNSLFRRFFEVFATGRTKNHLTIARIEIP